MLYPKRAGESHVSLRSYHFAGVHSGKKIKNKNKIKKMKAGAAAEKASISCANKS